MPRRARVIIPGYPHHIVQRGHRQTQVFFSDFDRLDYLNTLRECREQRLLRVYAYCLMSNHVHLILDPGNDVGSISFAMKRLAGRHARRLNRIHGWKGALWECRFKCSPIDTDSYLLACGRYVDLNPVRAGMVSRPEDYDWSSYRARAGLELSDLLDEDPSLSRLANNRAAQEMRYREFVGAGSAAQELQLFRDASQRNQLTGTGAFVEHVAKKHGLLVLPNKPGRQYKNVRDPD